MLFVIAVRAISPLSPAGHYGCTAAAAVTDLFRDCSHRRAGRAGRILILLTSSFQADRWTASEPHEQVLLGCIMSFLLRSTP
jgi:hypothetical protein